MESDNEYQFLFQLPEVATADPRDSLRAQHTSGKHPCSMAPPREAPRNPSGSPIARDNGAPACVAIHSILPNGEALLITTRLESSPNDRCNLRCRGNTFSLGRDRE